jgi:predicted nucleic-acid-binding protein
VKITLDTNVLVRTLVGDDPDQLRSAQAALKKADLIAVTTPMLCECVWVLSRGYRLPPDEIANAIRSLIASRAVEANRPAIEAGLAAMDSGGDFADGVIAFEGASLGGDTFASFDKETVALLKKQGRATLLLQ